MTNQPEKACFEIPPCESPTDHQIGQKYDERRGVGNGGYYCFKCGKTMAELIEESHCRGRESMAGEIEDVLDDHWGYIEGRDSIDEKITRLKNEKK